jgi:hypothetical protein
VCDISCDKTMDAVEAQSGTEAGLGWRVDSTVTQSVVHIQVTLIT